MKLGLFVLSVLLLLAGWPKDVMASEKETQKPLYCYHYIDPKVVYRGNQPDVFTLEVGTSGENIAHVRLLKPIESEMFDDGTHGDRVAGDGIYTINKVLNKTSTILLKFGGTHATWGIFRISIEQQDGTKIESSVDIGLVKEDISFPVVQFGAGLSATEYAFFIEDPVGDVLGTPDWPLGAIGCGKTFFKAFEKLYSVLPDQFDFVIIMPAHTIYEPARDYAENVPYFVPAKNEIQHIGMPLSNNTAKFYSKGRLMGMVYHSWGTGAILDHEFGHAWCAYAGQSLGLSYVEGSYGPHWNPNSDIGGQMSAFLMNPNVQYGGGHLKANGDGTWCIERTPGDNEPYSQLDLYLMGLIAPEEVSPITILVNPNITNHLRVTAESIKTVTIQDIIKAEGGERSPASKNSPKQFNVAFVAVKNKAFTPAEYAFYSLISKYFASKEQGESFLTTFYTATGGRATLNPRLPVSVHVESSPEVALAFGLKQNYPNPFNPVTHISFQVRESGQVVVKVYNTIGQEIKTLVDRYCQPGSHQIEFNAAGWAAGIYFYQIKMGNYLAIRKMVLLE
ncbi:T9SS type A sorting domain-containing protein [candidate division KSB1 bacterium]|nr:T9SS type A sorting domain-containing protein [candidate division KSB1 bacterium]